MSGAVVRDLIPIDRISAARIRRFLREDGRLGQWSRAGKGGIRPTLLARLVRNCIWEGLDLPLDDVRKRLAKPGHETCYQMTVEVEVGPKGDCGYLRTQARFIHCGSGRIAAQIELCTAGTPIRLTASRILLAARRSP